MITEVQQQGRFYRLSTGRAAHYENSRPITGRLVRATKHGRTLLVEPASEVNEEGIREKNDGNESMWRTRGWKTTPTRKKVDLEQSEIKKKREY